MATAPMIEEVVEPQGLTLIDILSGGNLAELLDPAKLTEIGQRVVDDVEIDCSSRGEWETRYKRSLDVAMQVKKAKNFPWPKAANVKYPILTVASVQFQARAYPAIVDGSNLVKGRVLGPDPDGTKRARADRIGQHMTWQLLYRMPGWEEETDKLLLMLPITGCVFRKTWYDSIENANRSEIVSGEDFIINYWAKSIETAPRYTQVLHYYPYEVREFIASGQWLDIPIDDEDSEKNSGDDDQGLGKYYEQHRTIDLDGDGYPEHYVVTCTQDGDVARIVPCFGPENVRVMALHPATGEPAAVVKLTELLELGRPDLAGNVVKIERRQYFTKYGFIPAPDGSFYDIGFGSLLDDITQTIDTTLNQMLDAGALQNAQGGFIGSGVNVRGGNFSFRLGEWKRVDVPGGALKDNIMPYAAPGPSSVLFNLLQFLVTGAKEITAASDALTGMGASTEQPTTLLARIEQAQKVLTGVIKRVHRAFGNELRILRFLNSEYLDDEEYFNLTDPVPMTGEDGEPQVDPDGEPVMTDVASIGRADYAMEDLDVVPVSDPSQISDVLRMARSDAEWATFNGDPLVNQIELRRRRMEALGIVDIKTMLTVPKQGPDPKLVVEMGKLDVAKIDAESRRTTAQAGASKSFAEGAEKLAAMGLLPDAATLAAHAVQESAEEDMNEPDNAGGVPGMGGEPADAGVPGPAPQPPVGADGGMGLGGAGFPGEPGPGGGAGGIVPPEVPGGAPV